MLACSQPLRKGTGPLKPQTLAQGHRSSLDCSPTRFFTHTLPFSLFPSSREREMELYGPKKRGPKPKTFLLKVRWPCPATGGQHCCSVRFWGRGP